MFQLFPVSCHLCHKILQTKVGYDDHMKRHQGVYRYNCTFCNKGFSGLKDLKEHTTKHTNENYFKCTKCTESFRYHNQWKTHEEKHKTQLMQKDWGGFLLGIKLILWWHWDYSVAWKWVFPYSCSMLCWSDSASTSLTSKLCSINLPVLCTLYEIFISQIRIIYNMIPLHLLDSCALVIWYIVSLWVWYVVCICVIHVLVSCNVIYTF